MTNDANDKDDEIPDPPEGLRDRGRAFWNEMQELGTWDEAETLAIEEACRCLDAIAELSVAVDRDGHTVSGSRGQIVVHPGVQEIRLQQTTMARLLGLVRMPLSDEEQAEFEAWKTKRAKAGAAARHR
ncbi:P27 family phage terminase small subunit [Microbacterium sp. NPDC058062]|uniref:P27 family phage terminase small subunit n=1 Tax=Microbacterium sp. NPDC058062 TaxID=3346320 RepID=UPI0036D8C084